MRTVRILIAACLVGLFAAAPASAGAPIAPVDACFEITHSSSNPFGSPSYATAYLTLSPDFGGTFVDLAATGASGNIFGAGKIAPNGLAIVDLPLYSYGAHRITEGVIDSAGGGPMLDPTGLEFVVDASQPRCDLESLTYVTTTTTTTTSTTTTTTTTTLASAPSTTVAAETTTTEAATTTVAAGGETSTSDGGGPIWIFVGLGAILIFGGYILFRGPGSPCEDELAKWIAAQRACNEATAAAEAAQRACDDAQQAVDDLEDERKQVCRDWPPACWETEDGGWIENAGDPGSRITQRDLHMRKLALGDLWERYRAGEASAEQVEAAWQRAETPEFREEMRSKDAAARADLGRIDGALTDARSRAEHACSSAAKAQAEAESACADAAAAKAAYDACMAAAPPPPPPPAPTPPTTGGDEPGTGGSLPGTTPPPEPPASTPEDEDEDPVCCPCGEWWIYGWTVGGILGWGKETTIATLICRCNPDRWVTINSESHRAGLALGGETSFFVGYLWGAPHAADIPAIWKSQSASGFDFDISLGPSITKGLKQVAKDVGKGPAWDYLKWAARNEVPWSNLDPRRLPELIPSATDVARGSLKDQVVGQQMSPQMIIVPVGAGVQVGVWHKWCTGMNVMSRSTCGCTPIGW